MNLGLYLGRHAGEGGGIALYARSLLRSYLRLLEAPEFQNIRLFVYGESTVIDPALETELQDFKVRHPERLSRRPLKTCSLRKLSILTDQRTIGRWAEADALDVIQSTSNYGVICSKRKQVVTVHDLFQAWPTESTGRSPVRFFYRQLFLRQIPKSTAIICDTNSVREEIVRRFGYPDERTQVIPLGLDDAAVQFLADCKIGSQKPQEVRGWLNQHSLSPGYLFFTASSDPRKNLAHCLKACSATNPDIQIVVRALDEAAEQRTRQELPAALSAKVKFLPWLERDAMFALYCGARVCLFPTLAEGYGFPAVEALAFHCQLVSAKLDCLEDLPQKDLHICDPRSVESITQALSRALGASARASADRLQDRFAALQTSNEISQFPTLREMAHATLGLVQSVAENRK